MKHWLLTCLLLASCTGGPSITRTGNGGYHATAGFTLAAQRENVVAEVVTREGDMIRYSTTSEDSTEVPSTWIWWKGTTKLAEIQQPAILKGTDDPDVIPKDPNVIPKDPNIIPLDPNIVQ
jgi:hypothetical protein